MSLGNFPDAFTLLLPFSMSPHPTPSPSSTTPTTITFSSRSEKLLRDTLLRDERERQQLSSSSTPLTHRRRHSHIPISTYSASIREDYAHNSFLFRTAMSNPRSSSPASSFSQGKDTEYLPIQNTISYQHSSPSSSRRSSPSTSPSPSPSHMRRRQEPFGQTTPHATTSTNTPPRSNTNILPNRRGSPYPSPSHRQGESLQMTPQKQVSRARLERGLTVIGVSNNDSKGVGNRNEIRGEQGERPQRRDTGSGSESVVPFAAPATGYSPSLSHARSRSQTDPNPRTFSKPNSPRRKSSILTRSSPSLAKSSPSGSSNLTRSNSKSTKKLPSPLLLGDAKDGGAEKALRLPTPPPTPPMAGSSLDRGYAPSPYKTGAANPSPNGTPTRIPVRVQTQRKKEGGLEMRRPTQRHAIAAVEKGKKEPLRPLEFSSASSRQRQRDVTITQQSRLSRTSPNPLTDPTNNGDDHSLASTDSCSTRTSESSISHVDVGSGYCACSSHSSLDRPVYPQHHVSIGHHDPHALVEQSSVPSPSPTTKPFNARKASTQCRAIQGYVSFASVEGLGEPPLVGDEFDDDGERGKGKGEMGGIPFLPLGMWNAALVWRKFLGGGTGKEREQGVVV